MGSGSSKKKHDEDEVEPFDQEFPDEVVHRKASRTQKKPQVQAAAAKSNRKIVGLIDSSDEEQEPREVRRKSGGDDGISEDIDDLEKTFDSLGLVGKKLWKDQAYSDDQTRTFASSGRWNHNASATSEDTGYLSSSQRGQIGSRSMPSRSVRQLKFSWDDQRQLPDRQAEEWTYKQTVIDGFDPDKFRKANKTSDTGIHIERQSGGTFARDDRVEMPGSVPTYDKVEQQILASIEQELGVM